MGRFDGHDTHALVAGDTFEPLVERIAKMLSHDRRMTVIRQDAKPYVREDVAEAKNKTKMTLDQARDFMRLSPLTIEPGLRLDPREDEPIEVTSTTLHGERRDHFWVRLGPASHGFGFSTDDAPTEAQMRAYWERRGLDYDSPVTQVRITGFGTEPNRHDRIEIESYNEHRYGRITTITFQCDRDY